MIITIVGGLAFAIVMFTRGQNLRKWGASYGLERKGNMFFGSYNGSEVEVKITETQLEKQGEGKDYKHYLLMEAAATIVGDLPEGLHIAGARFRGDMEGERVLTPDRLFNDSFRVFAIDVSKTQTMLRVPGITNVLLNLREVCPDLKVVNGLVHMRLSLQQETSDDPRGALDHGFTTVMKAAQAISWASFGQPMDDDLATTRPEPVVRRQLATLPKRKSGREI